jgi:predicted nucleic acid-binding protein
LKPLLDADVLIGALDGNDPHHGRARQLFTDWREQQATPLISFVNLAEVLIAPAGDSAKCGASNDAVTGKLCTR